MFSCFSSSPSSLFVFLIRLLLWPYWWITSPCLETRGTTRPESQIPILDRLGFGALHSERWRGLWRIVVNSELKCNCGCNFHQIKRMNVNKLVRMTREFYFIFSFTRHWHSFHSLFISSFPFSSFWVWIIIIMPFTSHRILPFDSLPIRAWLQRSPNKKKNREEGAHHFNTAQFNQGSIIKRPYKVPEGSYEYRRPVLRIVIRSRLVIPRDKVPWTEGTGASPYLRPAKWGGYYRGRLPSEYQVRQADYWAASY